ncbi:MAG: ATPase [Bacteroidetes bacterium]|nr:MAG: ATPase [Bacteroidota bacterium]
MAASEENITPLQERIRQLLEHLSRDLFEKEKPMRMALLSALAGESIFLLGPPGVAKSMIARRLKYAFDQAKSFEYLMGKFSTPDEVFGPVSISKLKNEDKYERLTDKYLPGAHIVFLDEIWKASPPIQNSLLTVLNEKVFRNGEQEFRVDIRGLISASNELPARGEGLEALWDRFLIRMMVGNIDDDILFERMLALPSRQDSAELVPQELKIRDHEYHAWREAMSQVKTPPHVLGLITHMRRTIRQRNETAEPSNRMYVSDRRWRKISQLLRAAAYLHGRDEVLVADCLLVSDCIWENERQTAEAADLVLGCIASFGYRKMVNLTGMEEELENLREEITDASRKVHTETQTIPKIYKDKFNTPHYQLLGFWGETPVFIRASDYEKLRHDQMQHIPVYEQTNQTFRPFQTYGFLLKSAFVVENKDRDVGIETEEIEKEIITPQTPTAEMKKIWSSQAQLLLQTCEQGIKKVEERRRQDETSLRGHLFIDSAHTIHALDSLVSLHDDLISLRLEIQKTRHLYESVPES